MFPIMVSITSILERKLNIFTIEPHSNPREVLSLSVTDTGLV
jgi:hypothetical protein